MLASILLYNLGMGIDLSHSDFVNDSIPIVVAGGRRSGRAKAVNELCNKGYCASKDMWYNGVKLHIFAQCNYKKMSTPVFMTVS